MGSHPALHTVSRPLRTPAGSAIPCAARGFHGLTPCARQAYAARSDLASRVSGQLTFCEGLPVTRCRSLLLPPPTREPSDGTASHDPASPERFAQGAGSEDADGRAFPASRWPERIGTPATVARLKWLTRAAIHGTAPAIARHLFTLHYACLRQTPQLVAGGFLSLANCGPCFRPRREGACGG